MDSNYAQNILIKTLQEGAIPNHVAFIMDGNRRYSKVHGMTIAEGLFRGSEAMTKV
jgi:ditrans,polycis-polyprenyl diphosphate synthase